MFALAAPWIPLLMTTQAAQANERRFTYVYDTLVLPLDIREIEPWVTLTPANVGGYRLATRLEFEFPVTERLMSALYLNGGASFTSAGLESVSSEWKLNVLNRALKPVGLALYGELTAGPHVAELEGKVLLDKEMDAFLAALNVVGEAEWEWEDGEDGVEQAFYGVLELLGGLAWVPAGGPPSVGVEVVDVLVFEPGEGLTRHRLSAGPTVGLARTGWWGAVTWMPELLDGLGADAETLSSYSVRVLLGFDI